MNKLTLKEAYAGRIIAGAVAGVLTLGIAVGAYRANKAKYYNPDHMPSMGISAGEIAGSEYEDMACRIAEEYGLRPSIVCAVIERESDWCPLVVNPDSGAAGLMQIIPETWDWIVSEMGEKLDPLDPEDNIRAGCYLLKECLAWADGDLALALDMYGIGRAGALERRAWTDKPTGDTAWAIRRAQDYVVRWCKGDRK